MKNKCHNCHQPIRNGQAVIRSIAFERVAFHTHCATARGISFPKAEVAL